MSGGTPSASSWLYELYNESLRETYDALDLPSSYGGPLNHQIVEWFDLAHPNDGVDGLDGEGDFIELFFGAGASVVLGLEGSISVKLERKSPSTTIDLDKVIYEMTFLIQGSVTGDLMAGLEAGVKGNLAASGMVQVGIPVVYKFVGRDQAIKGTAIGMRLALMMGTTPLIKMALPYGLGWLADAFLLERSWDDINFITKHLVEGGIEFSASAQFGAEVSDLGIGDGGGGDPRYSAFAAAVGVGGAGALYLKYRNEDGEPTLTIGAKEEYSVFANKSILFSAQAVEAKTGYALEFVAKNFTSEAINNGNWKRVLQTSSKDTMIKSAKKQIKNPEANFSVAVVAATEGTIDLLWEGKANIEAEMKFTIDLLTILRTVYTLFDETQDQNDAITHLASIWNVELGAKSQTITGFTISESIKAFGLGLSLKYGLIRGHNNPSYPKKQTYSAANVAELITSWLDSQFT